MKTVIRRSMLRAVRRQAGVSLVIVLVLLVAMSLLGIAILRSTAMQERMSANLRDRNLAFQSAEAGLRYAQDQLGAGAWDVNVPVAANCVAGVSICPTGTGTGGANPAVVWSTVPTADFDPGQAIAPEYWIEYLGLGPGRKGSCDLLPPTLDCYSPMYRITVRSRAVGRADVVLQANVISRIPEPGT